MTEYLSDRGRQSIPEYPGRFLPYWTGHLIVPLGSIPRYRMEGENDGIEKAKEEGREEGFKEGYEIEKAKQEGREQGLEEGKKAAQEEVKKES